MASMISRRDLNGGDGVFDPARAHRDGRTGYGDDIDYERPTRDGPSLSALGYDPQPARAVRYLRGLERAGRHLAGILCQLSLGVEFLQLGLEALHLVAGEHAGSSLSS